MRHGLQDITLTLINLHHKNISCSHSFLYSRFAAPQNVYVPDKPCLETSLASNFTTSFLRLRKSSEEAFVRLISCFLFLFWTCLERRLGFLFSFFLQAKTKFSLVFSFAFLFSCIFFFRPKLSRFFFQRHQISFYSLFFSLFSPEAKTSKLSQCPVPVF